MRLPLASIWIERLLRLLRMSVYGGIIGSTILNSANISTHFSLFSTCYAYNHPIFHHHPPYAQDPRTHIVGFSIICTILRGGRYLVYYKCVPESRYRAHRPYRRYILYVRCYPDPWSSDRWTTRRPDLPQEYIDR